MSDDGAQALCIIVFIGSVFSPYYAWARRREQHDPHNHCAVNVSLTGAVNRWTMTERPRTQVRVRPEALEIGSSAMYWDGKAVEFRLSEVGCPLPAPVRGRVRLLPTILGSESFALDQAQQHLWSPLAPRARIEVRLEQPALSWCGEAYLDSNIGTRPLEQDFRSWTWSRAAMATGTSVFYEVQHRRDASPPLALRFERSGEASRIALPQACTIARSRWGITRQARSDEPAQARLLHTMVDAPFYVRSLLATPLAGQSTRSVHESVDLDRLRRGWVKCLLPFRMPRWPLWG